MSDSVENMLRELLQGQAEMARRFERIESRLRKIEGPQGGGTVLEPIEPVSSALSLNKPENSEVILCLDFGTARSKAFATSGDAANLLDLAIGLRAGQQQSVHSLLSCVFISDDGLFWFGEDAAQRSEQAVGAGSRRRFESFKSMLTNASPGSDLRAVDCHEQSNPTTTRLTDGDVLTMYLAFLTDMAASELEARHGVSRHVRRRFTMPVFQSEHRIWGERELRKHFAEAVLIADHFSGRWRDGIPVAEAARVLLGATRRYRDVLFLIEDALVEPVAAFGSRFRDTDGVVKKRTLITIVDVGAGTTDFASFCLIPDEAAGFTMFQIPGSVNAIRKAGDEVDRLLADYILKEAAPQHVHADESVMARVRADLKLRQRIIKEQLFTDGIVEVHLSDDTAVIVDRDKFVDEEHVKEFASALGKKFIESLQGMHESWIGEAAQGEVTVVATGGGATLPFIKGIGNGAVGKVSRLHHLQYAKTVPSWVSEFEELIREYPQLAVAIGGAARELPEQADVQFSGFGGLGGSESWVISPVLKGA